MASPRRFERPACRLEPVLGSIGEEGCSIILSVRFQYFSTIYLHVAYRPH